jgi:ketosteroid isomerase-like protein
MANPSAALDQVRLAMASTNDLFNKEVLGKRNYDALDQVYTAGARILPPGASMIFGRAAIKQFWAGLVEAVHATAGVLTSIEVIPAGDSVVEIGQAVLTVAPPDQPSAELEVKYVVYWKQEDGRWKWDVDIWNQNS